MRVAELTAIDQVGKLTRGRRLGAIAVGYIAAVTAWTRQWKLKLNKTCARGETWSLVAPEAHTQSKHVFAKAFCPPPHKS